jgi:hypothetical protein
MFRFTRNPASGSHSQYLAKITYSVQCEYMEVVWTLSALWLHTMTCEACVHSTHNSFPPTSFSKYRLPHSTVQDLWNSGNCWIDLNTMAVSQRVLCCVEHVPWSVLRTTSCTCAKSTSIASESLASYRCWLNNSTVCWPHKHKLLRPY